MGLADLAGWLIVFLKHRQASPRTGTRVPFRTELCRREEGLWLAQVQVKPNESLDSALKRFKKVLQQTGVLKEAKEHEHYEKPSDKRRKAEAAKRRKMKRL